MYEYFEHNWPKSHRLVLPTDGFWPMKLPTLWDTLGTFPMHWNLMPTQGKGPVWIFWAQWAKSHTSDGWILTDEVSNPLRHPRNISHALKPHAHSREGPCMNILSIMGQKSQAHTSHGWILTDEVSNPLRHPKNISHALKPHAHSREGPCMNILSIMGQKSQARTSHGWILTDEGYQPFETP